MKFIKGYLLFFFTLHLIFNGNRVCAQQNNNKKLDSITLKHLPVISKKYSALSLSGYLQPQFQIAQTNGTQAEFQGGNFGEYTNNRFSLRRGRLKVDYMLLNNDGSKATNIVFQFDGTERGVSIKDFYGRYFENKWKILAVTLGLSVRPFGNEVQLSSSVREAPERGRMSQTLMKSERDLGITLTLNPRWRNAKLKNIALDLGIYNGQGLTGKGEFDNSKDFLFRLSHKPYKIKNNLSIAGGISTLQGGLNHHLPISYKMGKINNKWLMVKDSSLSTINKVAPRKYYGADIQLKTVKKNWQSEFRAELITGLQTATSTTSVTPGSLPVDNKDNPLPYYTRNFTGAYFTFVQSLKNTNNQLIFKYDWYDPNTKVKGFDIEAMKRLSDADIRFDTFGFGFLHHFNKHFKAELYYEVIKNEITKISGYYTDRKDNVFTLRTQFYF